MEQERDSRAVFAFVQHQGHNQLKGFTKNKNKKYPQISKSKLEISQRERHMNTWSRPGWCLLLCGTGTETEATCGGTLVGLLLLFLLHLRDNNDNNINNSDNDNCKKDTSLSMTTCIIYKQLSTELHKMCTNDTTLREFV